MNVPTKRYSDETFLVMLDKSLRRSLLGALFTFLVLGATAGVPWIFLNVIFVFNLNSINGGPNFTPIKPQELPQMIVLSSGLWLFWWLALGRQLKQRLLCIWQLINPQKSWIRRHLLVEAPQVSKVTPVRHGIRYYGILINDHYVFVQFANGWQYRLTVKDTFAAHELAQAIAERARPAAKLSRSN